MCGSHASSMPCMHPRPLCRHDRHDADQPALYERGGVGGWGSTISRCTQAILLTSPSSLPPLPCRPAWYSRSRGVLWGTPSLLGKGGGACLASRVLLVAADVIARLARDCSPNSSVIARPDCPTDTWSGSKASTCLAKVGNCNAGQYDIYFTSATRQYRSCRDCAQGQFE